MESLPLEGKVGFAEQNSDEVGKYKVKIFNGCIRNLHLISHFVTASPLGEALRKMTHLWVVSRKCMAGRPIKDALVRSR